MAKTTFKSANVSRLDNNSPRPGSECAHAHRTPRTAQKCVDTRNSQKRPGSLIVRVFALDTNPPRRLRSLIASEQQAVNDYLESKVFSPYNR